MGRTHRFFFPLPDLPITIGYPDLESLDGSDKKALGGPPTEGTAGGRWLLLKCEVLFSFLIYQYSCEFIVVTDSGPLGPSRILISEAKRGREEEDTSAVPHSRGMSINVVK